MSSPQNCTAVTDGAANGIAAALQAVDCVAGNVTGQAFGRLFAPGGSMATVLTILLTLYVAFFAIQLLTGRATLGVRSLTPRMMTVGLVLTFATSWVAYQSVVWNLAVGAPDWIAGVLTGDRGSATQTFAAKIDVVFAAVQEANRGANDISAFSPPGMMWLGAILLLLGTVGVLVTARIALAVLIALGPIFVVLALFPGTRGLFAGWVKGLTMLALAPLFAVLGGSVMLELSVPMLAALVASAGQIDPQAAVGFFMVGAVHMALMVMVLKVAGAMVAGWTVFGLAVPERDRDRGGLPAGAAAPRATPQVTPAQEAGAAIAAARRIDISAQPLAMAPANDGGGTSGAVGVSGQRTTVVHTAASPSGQVAPLTTGPSRTQGIGNRFKPANALRQERMK
ncbi:type IV secretion system protein [Qipengyuania sediminis]|uniref:type IV secretion system protein n=1 Tax=Qipengyuania sediminis TaxID=1532023 RepID=UPI00105950DF|nr:type IV secretion system protein [Qipengyuania sediminis]